MTMTESISVLRVPGSTGTVPGNSTGTQIDTIQHTHFSDFTDGKLFGNTAATG